MRTLAPWQIRKVTAHVDANLASPLRVRDLAALTRLTRGSFSRAFRGSLGQSPQAYILCQRMAFAEQLLLESDEPLARIAQACGLYDQSYFARLFRRVKGTPPAAWRRERRRGLRPGSVPCA